MQNLSVTLVQANQQWENKTANLAHFDDLLHQVSTTDIIVLPEMFHTAFTMNATELAESSTNGMAISWLKQKAIEKNAAIYASFIAEENGHYYNRGAWVEPTGKVVFYDKRKTFGLAGEDKIYTAGKEAVVVHYKGWNICLQICYDLRFPEQVKNATIGNQAFYDLLIYVANWPERRNTHWKALLQARAIENQCYVVGVNRVGEDALGLTYSGDSGVWNPLGERMDQIAAHVETVENQVLNFTFLTETREKLPFLKDSTYRLFEK